MEKHCHIRCNGLPLCVIENDTAEKIGFPTCESRTHEEALFVISKCQNSLTEKEEDLSNFRFDIIEGNCLEA